MKKCAILQKWKVALERIKYSFQLLRFLSYVIISLIGRVRAVSTQKKLIVTCDARAFTCCFTFVQSKRRDL